MNYAEFLRKNGAEMTAKEVADALGIKRDLVYKYAQAAGVTLKSSNRGGRPTGSRTKDYTMCSFRPYGCFNCPNDECICSDSCTDAESAYLFIGMQHHEQALTADGRLRKKQRHSKKLQKG